MFSFHYLFRHCVQIILIFLGIVSEHRLSFSASCLAFSYLPRHCVRALLIFFGIASGFHYLFQHRVQASLIYFGIEPGFHYLFRHYVRIFLIVLGIMSEHHLSFLASHQDFSYLHWHCVRITHLPRHCAWVSFSTSVMETQFR